MLDRLAGALRRYELLRPQPNGRTTLNKGQELADWIERDVGCVVDELSQRPLFRTQARWPLDHLLPGARSSERQRIESIEMLLASTAQRLAAFARRHSLTVETPVVAAAAAHATITVGGEGHS
ncbi:MAG TPA: hypothetical protein VHC19_24535, partial [Pirellulales bacterium]|nr:hypothetical protein [Pirellulales bacterium]